MLLLADDPIVGCMERCGWPPWMLCGGDYEDEQEEDEDGEV